MGVDDEIHAIVSDAQFNDAMLTNVTIREKCATDAALRIYNFTQFIFKDGLF